jgi:hypothetical protein
MKMIIPWHLPRFLTATLAATLCLAIAGTARADRLDGELVKLTTTLTDHMKDAKAKTVGVLKFRASLDGGKEDFHVGPINNLMADRLETTLVLGYNIDPDWIIDVIHDATLVASRKGLSYLPADKAVGLFNLKYPLVATGNEATADIFFTGVVQFDTKKHTTTVVIQSLTRDHPQLQEVAKFTVPTERVTVAESGRSFVINRSLAERDAGPQKDEAKDEPGAEAEKAAEEQKVAAKDPKIIKDPTPGVLPAATEPEKMVNLEVLYNGELIPLEPDARDPGGRAFVRDPKEKDTVSFVLVNQSKNLLAVALLVNGFNTANDEKVEPRYCTKWILEPNKKLLVEGFYVGGSGRNNVKPFRVASDEESEALFEMSTGDLRNERLGTISMHVFVQGERQVGGDAPVTRGLTPAQIKNEGVAVKSIDDLKRALYQSVDKGKANRMLSRGLIADDGKRQDGSRLVPKEFNNATEVQHLQIRYYQRKQSQ